MNDSILAVTPPRDATKAEISSQHRAAKAAVRRATNEPIGIQILLIGLALGFLGLFLFVPLVVVFAEAFRKGWEVYVASIQRPKRFPPSKLTLLVAAITLPLNTIFGVAAAWSIAKFRFKGKSVLITLIDLAFAVSP
jgi:sulfate transport system permease protein